MSQLNKLTKYCKELLLNLPQAENVRIYADKRFSKNIQDKFDFGYFPSQEYLDVLSAEISFEELSKLELVFDKIYYNGITQKNVRYSTMQNHNLIMPYRNCYGDIIGIVGRSTLSDKERDIKNISKYKNTSFDKGLNLFGLNEAKESIIKNDIVYIVEGQPDFLKAYDKGLFNVVALGSSSMTFDQLALLVRYTDNIVLLLDNDNAGIAGSEKIIKQFGKLANIKIGKIPNGYKDLDEYLNDFGIEDFHSKIII